MQRKRGGGSDAEGVISQKREENAKWYLQTEPKNVIFRRSTNEKVYDVHAHNYRVTTSYNILSYDDVGHTRQEIKTYACTICDYYFTVEGAISTSKHFVRHWTLTYTAVDPTGKLYDIYEGDCEICGYHVVEKRR